MPNPLRPRRLLVVVAAALGLALVPAQASSAAPLVVQVYAGQSIATALRTVAPGGTVVVHAGTYPALSLSSSTWTSRVTLRSDPFDQGDVVIAGISLVRVHNLTISGVRTTAMITIDGGSAVDVVSSSPSAVAVKNGATGIDIVDNDITGGWNGIAVTSWNGAPRPRDVRISGNRVSGQANDNIQVGIADDVTIEDNVLRDTVMNANHNDGIQFMGGERLVVRRNRISGHDQAMIIQPEAQLGAGNRVGDARVENNIVSHTRGAGFIVSGTVGSTIVNNTVYDTPYASVHLVGQNSDLVIANNVLEQIWRVSGASAPAFEDHNCVVSGGSGAHDVRSDPQFVDRVHYRLALTSPCRDLGRLDDAPVDDFDRLQRGPRPDAGAREVAG